MMMSSCRASTTSVIKRYVLQKRSLASNTTSRSRQTPLNKTAEDPVDVGEIAQKLGVRLTGCEKELLKKRLDINKDGIVTQSDFTLAGQRALQHRAARELCLQVIEEPTTPTARIGKQMIRIMDSVGLGLFSAVGTRLPAMPASTSLVAHWSDALLAWEAEL